MANRKRRRERGRIEERIMQNASHISKVAAQIRVRERAGVPGRGIVLVPGVRYDLTVQVAPGETLADVTRPEWFDRIEETPAPPAQDQEETE